MKLSYENECDSSLLATPTPHNKQTPSTHNSNLFLTPVKLPPVVECQEPGESAVQSDTAMKEIATMDDDEKLMIPHNNKNISY